MAGREALHRKVQQVLDVPMLVLSLVFLVVLCWPVLNPHLGSQTRSALTVADYGIWAAFALEYAALLATAPHRMRFVRTHIPDLLVVVLPMLRPLRILRSARLFRLVRLGRVISIVAQAAHRSRAQFVSRAAAYTAGVGCLVMLGASVMVLDVERDAAHANIRSFGDAIWWSASTMTTIGEGDRYPVTAPGKAVSVVLMFASLCLAGILTACVAAWFVNISRPTAGDDATHRQLAELTTAVDALRAQVAALGADGATPSSP